MTNQIVESSTIESVVVQGDLSKLTPEQRVTYYRNVCNSIGLNPMTRPFDYITLNGKLTLYARKDAADQLRKLNGVSIGKPDIQFEDDWIIVSVMASVPSGRTDSDVGVIKKTDMQNNLGNAIMKAVAKAKRRVTLSICGLGMLDETEVETIPDALPVLVAETGEVITGEVVEQPKSMMTVEMAKSIQSSDGIPYGEIDSEKLGHMLRSINTKLGKQDLTPEEREQAQMKKDAILVIQKSRQ